MYAIRSYYDAISIYGEPGRETNWGWLVQGHHMGISFTVAGDRATFAPIRITSYNVCYTKLLRACAGAKAAPCALKLMTL